LARELVALARSERDTAAAELLNVTQQRSLSERPLETIPVRSERRMRSDRGGEGRTVLLVEDEPLLLKTMSRLLEQYGHRVLAATNADDALKLAAFEPAIELVVTDLALPGMPGTELVGRLRTKVPSLRVLFMSGWDPASSGVTLARDGTEAFLSKPFSAAELDERLSELLGTLPLELAENR
jgi:CheY-like chemotaxis protein